MTDAAIPFLARLPALEHVKLYNTRVTASGLQGFRSVPRLMQLDMFPYVAAYAEGGRALPGCRTCTVQNNVFGRP